MCTNLVPNVFGDSFFFFWEGVISLLFGWKIYLHTPIMSERMKGAGI
jgi:hypothetical protein